MNLNYVIIFVIKVMKEKPNIYYVGGQTKLLPLNVSNTNWFYLDLLSTEIDFNLFYDFLFHQSILSR